MNVRAVGDSITFGQYLPSLLDRWPNLIGAEARAVCNETTRQALERFPHAVQAEPAGVTVLQWGHNDANSWATDGGLPRVSLPAYAANMVEMIERCLVFRTRPVLCTITPVIRDGTYMADVARYDEELRRIADAQGVPIADVRAAFQRAGDLDRLLLPDGLHLSAAGHQVYAATVAGAIAALDFSAIPQGVAA